MSSAKPVHILGLSGSLRARSTARTVLLAAIDEAPEGVTYGVYDGMSLLPHFNPDDDIEPPSREVVALRKCIEAADAVLICTPEYAGSLPGSFKNLLDWTIGAGSLYEKPVAWINASAHPDGARDAHDALAKVLEKTGARIVTEACANIPVGHGDVDEMGYLTKPGARMATGQALRSLAAALNG